MNNSSTNFKYFYSKFLKFLFENFFFIFQHKVCVENFKTTETLKNSLILRPSYA